MAQNPFPITLEAAWRELMKTLAITNAGRAKQAQLSVRGVQRIMGRK